MPSMDPSPSMTISPSTSPTAAPSNTAAPSYTSQPTLAPTSAPTEDFPTSLPSTQPTSQPTRVPASHSTSQPSRQPMSQPSNSPTGQPTWQPSSQGDDYSLPSNQSISVYGWFKCRVLLPFFHAVLSTGDGFVDFNVSRAKTVDGRVVLGSAQFGSLNATMTASFPAAGNDYSGRSLAMAGDVNGDGVDDVIIGVPAVSRVYVMYGTAQGTVNMNRGFVISGITGDYSGWAVDAAGDVNGDGIADVVIGAPLAKFNGKAACGAMYVIYGRNRRSPNIQLSRLTESQGTVIYGSAAHDYFGASVAGVGDVNGDGFDDVAVGAMCVSSLYSGSVTILYGGQAVSQVAVNELAFAEASTFSGAQFSWTGYSVAAAGDVNGDGLQDVVVGSLPWKGNWQTQSSYVYLGRVLIVPSGSIASVTSAISGGGVVVASAGDVNDDGYDDVLTVSSTDFTGGAFVMHPVGTLFTSEPSLAPSAKPTRQPSAAPSRRPTTATPSALPTAPTVSPTEVPTGPSFEPTMTPSQPTNSPSEAPSQSPSEVPTEFPTTTKPSRKPSLRPTSSSPSHIPSISPSVAPTTTSKPTAVPSTSGPTTVRPTSAKPQFQTRAPSLQPSIYSPPVRIYNGTMVINDGGRIQRIYGVGVYIINATANVEVAGFSSGNCTFVIAVTPNVTYSIEQFNNRSGKIDLSRFCSIHAFSQLTLRRGSTIVDLPDNQIVRIRNLNPEEVSERNFVFAEKGDSWLSFPVVAICSIVAAGIVFNGLLLVYHKHLQHSVRVKGKGRKGSVTSNGGGASSQQFHPRLYVPRGSLYKEDYLLNDSELNSLASSSFHSGSNSSRRSGSMVGDDRRYSASLGRESSQSAARSRSISPYSSQSQEEEAAVIGVKMRPDSIAEEGKEGSSLASEELYADAAAGRGEESEADEFESVSSLMSNTQSSFSSAAAARGGAIENPQYTMVYVTAGNQSEGSEDEDNMSSVDDSSEED